MTPSNQPAISGDVVDLYCSSSDRNTAALDCAASRSAYQSAPPSSGLSGLTACIKSPLDPSHGLLNASAKVNIKIDPVCIFRCVVASASVVVTVRVRDAEHR